MNQLGPLLLRFGRMEVLEGARPTSEVINDEFHSKDDCNMRIVALNNTSEISQDKKTFLNPN